MTRNLEVGGLITSDIPVLLRSTKSRYRGIQHDAHNSDCSSELGEEGGSYSTSYSTRESPEIAVEIQETAKQIIGKMTEEDAIIIHGRSADLPGVDTARLLDISRPIRKEGIKTDEF